MLTAEDSAIVARDPEIPGLPVLLDRSALAEDISSVLPEWRLNQLRVDYIRYKPHTYCLARVRYFSGSANRLAYVVAHSISTRSKLDKLYVTLAQDRAPLFQLLPKNLAIHRFPFDRCIPGLAAAMNSTALTALMQRAAPQLNCGDELAASVLQYKPERRCALELTLAGRSAAAMKAYTPKGYQQARRAAKTIGGMCSDLGPRCIGHSDRHAVMLFEWCKGKELSHLLDNTTAIRSALSAMAAVLSRLHHHRSSKLPRTSLADSDHHSLRQLNDLAYISEDLAAISSKIWHDAQSQIKSCQPHQSVPIHGDLHLDQIMVDGSDVQLLDFDRARLGDPAEDLSAIYVSLMRNLVVEGKNFDKRESLYEDFLDAYGRAGGSIEWRKVRAFIAVRLIQSLAEPFRYRQSEWLSKSWRLLQMAQRLLEKVKADNPGGFIARIGSNRHSAEVHVSDPFHLRTDNKLVTNGTLLCPQLTADRLRLLPSFDGEHAGIDIESIRVVRHKPGRRCLIEFKGHSRTSHQPMILLGKIDSKRRYERYFERQLAIWHSGFSSASSDGISVARPWGIVPEWNMWLQEKVSGHDPWLELYGAAGQRVGTRIAQALAKLHRCNLPITRIYGLQDELATLHDRLSIAAERFPQTSSRISRLLAECERISANVRPRVETLIHRDLYPDQVLIADQRVTIVDLDLLSRGNPAVDVGNFLAHLIERSLREWCQPHGYLPAATAFTGEYIRQRPDVSTEEIETYTLLSLARHVSLCATLPGRLPNAMRVLECCEKMLSF